MTLRLYLATMLYEAHRMATSLINDTYHPGLDYIQIRRAWALLSGQPISQVHELTINQVAQRLASLDASTIEHRLDELAPREPHIV